MVKFKVFLFFCFWQINEIKYCDWNKKSSQLNHLAATSQFSLAYFLRKIFRMAQCSLLKKLILLNQRCFVRQVVRERSWNWNVLRPGSSPVRDRGHVAALEPDRRPPPDRRHQRQPDHAHEPRNPRVGSLPVQTLRCSVLHFAKVFVQKCWRYYLLAYLIFGFSQSLSLILEFRRRIASIIGKVIIILL